jgi:hypothetical protein
MPSIGQTWVLASIGAVVEMGILSTLKRLFMESRGSLACGFPATAQANFVSCCCDKISPLPWALAALCQAQHSRGDYMHVIRTQMLRSQRQGMLRTVNKTLCPAKGTDTERQVMLHVMYFWLRLNKCTPRASRRPSTLRNKSPKRVGSAYKTHLTKGCDAYFIRTSLWIRGANPV